MKRIKITVTIFCLLSMVSCGTYYRMVTTLDRDGNAIREVYAYGDSAFMAGDMAHNPYLFDVSSDWETIRYDSISKYNFFGTEENINVKVSREVSSIALFSQKSDYHEDVKSFAAPKEMLTKKRRFFYTNYTLTTVYEKLDYNVPVSIDKYLSDEERRLWTQGDFSGYGIMNGSEMNDMLNGIETKFMDWYSRNCFEISLNSITTWSGQEISDVDKNHIYKQVFEKYQEMDIIPEIVCGALDAFYKANRFSELYRVNNESIDQKFEDATSVINQIGNVISYEFVLPGKIIATNAPINVSNSLTWKVDGIRILYDDYTLTAEYRVTNTWSFITCALILIAAVVSTILLLRRRIV